MVQLTAVSGPTAPPLDGGIFHPIGAAGPCGGCCGVGACGTCGAGDP